VITIKYLVVNLGNLVWTDIVATNGLITHITLTSFNIYDSEVGCTIEPFALVNSTPVLHTFNLVTVYLVASTPADQVLPAGSLTDELVTTLSFEYSDIIEAGAITKVPTSQAEIDTDDVVDLPRISFDFNRRSFGRLRALINDVNAAGSDTS